VVGTDNGTAFTSRAFRARLKDLGIAHRRGGYRDPESQAFIESFFSKLKERVVWRHEFETLDDARRVLGDYIDHRYPNRPHSRLGYKTPLKSSANRLTSLPNSTRVRDPRQATIRCRPS